MGDALSKQALLTGFQEAINGAIHGAAAPTNVGTNVAPSATDKKTVADLIAEREQQLEQLEQLQDIQASDMLNQLNQDNEAGSSAKAIAATASAGQTGEAGGAKKYEYNPDYDLDKLTEEKEAEIKTYVDKLDKMKRKIDTMKAQYERDTKQKTQTEEDRKEMAENLKSITKVNNKNKDILNELAKLGSQDMKALQHEVGELSKALEELKAEWDEYKKPINEEIFEQKQNISDKKVEYQYKVDKIKEIKKEIKEALQDLEHKKDMLKYYNQQWDKCPKDINRNQYLKRINEIIQNLKQQKVEIHNILKEITEIQTSTEAVMGEIKALDVQVEDFIFNEAKKDKVAKEIYKEIVQLKEDFDKLITNIQEQNKLRTQIRDIETKSDDFRIKYKNGAEIQKLVDDLNGIK